MRILGSPVYHDTCNRQILHTGPYGDEVFYNLAIRPTYEMPTDPEQLVVGTHRQPIIAGEVALN